jgi:DNA-nicking Smr family endonuclease
MKRRGKGGLTSEDEALWTHVARSVTRMEQRRRIKAPVSAADEAEDSNGERKSTPRARAPDLVSPPSRSSVQPPPLKSQVASRQPGPGTIEPRKAKRIAKGRDEIEGRIDLHGMRQVEAHGALRGFLMRAHQNGLRMVLVITGKGREDDQDRHAPFDMFQDRDRGVLRRNVPRWLAEPDLRSIVVGHTSASARHGGDGAFYVQLRNREKFRG